MSKFAVLVLGLLALVLIAACSPPPSLRDAKLLNDSSLVDNEPCTAPCWNNITPGVTDWQDAVTILEDDVNLENVTTQTDDNSASVVAEFQGVGGTACCQMFSEDGSVVGLIFLRLAPTNTTQQVLDNLGEPTYAIGSEFSDDQAIINLLYPELNTVVYSFVAGKEGELSASSEVVGVLYMKPEDMQLLISTSSLHAWDGFGPYAQYSPDNQDFEVTPEITLTPTPQGS